jgi:hypothetical protein
METLSTPFSAPSCCVQSGVWRDGKLASELEEWQCALAVEGASEAAAVAARVQVGGGSLPEAAQRLLADPSSWAYLAAAALVLTGRQLTPTLHLATSSLAAAHAPLALLALGMILDELTAPQPHQVQTGVRVRFGCGPAFEGHLCFLSRRGTGFPAAVVRHAAAVRGEQMPCTAAARECCWLLEWLDRQQAGRQRAVSATPGCLLLAYSCLLRHSYLCRCAHGLHAAWPTVTACTACSAPAPAPPHHTPAR